MTKKLRPGWSFNDGTELHIGHVPQRKSVCIYVVEGSVCHVLGYLRNEYAADMLAEYHAKLASGRTEQ
jgi:hypothetical protein